MERYIDDEAAKNLGLAVVQQAVDDYKKYCGNYRRMMPNLGKINQECYDSEAEFKAISKKYSNAADEKLAWDDNYTKLVLSLDEETDSEKKKMIRAKRDKIRAQVIDELAEGDEEYQKTKKHYLKKKAMYNKAHKVKINTESAMNFFKSAWCHTLMEFADMGEVDILEALIKQGFRYE